MQGTDMLNAVQTCVCPNCGAQLQSEQSVCPNCGAGQVETETYICTDCGAPVAADATVCPRCGADVSDVVVGDSSMAPALLARYTEGYTTAERLVALGGFVRIAGYMLAALLALATFASRALSQGAVSLVSWGSAGITVLAVGLLFYIWGTSLIANGQRLLATLDGAVNGSPFLTNDERAEIMGF